ncbi:MAG: hypothetical protein M0R06_05250 [Sphaerochaeta sp.]|jgi:hypothetical protein|nr:hypothetical protein [Sphaerochaeta sp.]
MQYAKVSRAAAGSIIANPADFPPPTPALAWAGNYLVGWQDPNTPVAFPGCFPFLPAGFDILKDGAEMFPDRAAICKANRHIHAQAGMTRSVAEFFPGQPLGALAGRKVILCGSGPSLGKYRTALERARADGVAVVCVNGAIQAVPNADVFFCLERCAKPEWWAQVNPNTTPVWTSPSANYTIADKWPVDRRFYFLHHWDVFDGWPDHPSIIDRLPPTLSCMVSSINCLQLLAYCGVAEVWLLGQDFAGAVVWNKEAGRWDPGPYYWDGSFPPELAGERCTLVRGIDGNNAATTGRLCLMGNATKIAADLVALNAGIPVYNIGQMGIIELPTAPDWGKYVGGAVGPEPGK